MIPDGFQKSEHFRILYGVTIDPVLVDVRFRPNVKMRLPVPIQVDAQFWDWRVIGYPLTWIAINIQFGVSLSVVEGKVSPLPCAGVRIPHDPKGFFDAEVVAVAKNDAPLDSPRSLPERRPDARASLALDCAGHQEVAF